MKKQTGLRDRPIGIFDSGLGGLTVVKEIIKILPNENIAYFGDTARVPYGSKSKETVTRFSIENAIFLLKHKAKLIIVACNTSSSLSLAALKSIFNIPIIGVIEPGVKKALSATKNNRIGIIGTRATVASRAYENEINKHSKNSSCITASCPLFVPLAEEGLVNGTLTRMVAKRYLAPLAKKKIDTLILGCTHYPLLKPVIQRAIGEGVKLVDSAEAVAEDAKKTLTDKNMLRNNKKAEYKFYVSDEPEHFRTIGERFLGRKVSSIEKV